MARARRRTATIAAAAALAVLAGCGAVVAATGGDGYAVRTEQLEVAGTPEPGTGPGTGPVRLDATLYLPAGAPRAPAVLLAHGFGGSKDDLAGTARRLAGRGYVALAWTARGFGRSGGLIHLDAPGYEVADARRLVDLLAGRPEVLLDAPGDPRVGVAGGSYGGALALLLAGLDRRVDAIVPQITWNDLRRALFAQAQVRPGPPASPAALDPVPVPGVFKKGWAGVFFSPSAGAPAGLSTGGSSFSAAAGASPSGSLSGAPGAATGAAAGCGRFAADLCADYQVAATTGRPAAGMLERLAASSPATVLDRITAPTMLVQGEADSLFPLTEADANARGIAAHGTPVRVVWFGGGHDGGPGTPGEEDRITAAADAWFDHYLRHPSSGASGASGASGSRPAPPGAGFEVTVPAVAVSSVNGRAAAQVRRAAGEPGVTAPGPPATREIPLQGPEQAVQAPAGASPAALTSVPGLGAALSTVGATGIAGLGVLPGQTARFESAPLGRALHLVGGSRVTLRVAGDGGDATLFVQLHDVAPDGTAVLPQQLVAPVYLPSTSPGGRDVTVATPAVVRDVAVGHRLRLVVSTTDQGYAMPTRPRQYRIAAAGVPSAGTTVLVAPDVVMASADVGGLRDLWPYALAVLVAAAGVVVAGRLAGRRRRAAPPDPALARVPLAVDGLGKAYPDGFRAVSDVSFRVESGWVLGLLGPNGAGKTTTLRMLMGLIRPSEGVIRVFGHVVTPGAPVLSRVGAFVEGPGFLPHIGGLANLRLYWQATGRPPADAHLEEALEIAGLGDDVHRRVKTYSQGMRQRLAIAQAMLGLPDLLVMDEPTNGLDPPQIREMREVLARYAATGRTVVVSSHLLSEVERTCTHAVVMHAGRLVAQGPVADLVGAATLLAVDVDDPARAARVVEGMPGVQDVEVTPTGLALSLVGTPRSELVRVLVEAGLAVDRVSPQRGLEQAFLALVGEEG